MEINVTLSLNIGQGQLREERDVREVPDNWVTLSEDERNEILNDMWTDWSNNYIDGGCWESDS